MSKWFFFSMLFSTGFAGFAVASDASLNNLLALPDVAVAQQSSDGTYDVVCTDGHREKVTDVDLRLNNVCPNNSNSVVSGVLSLQKRSDGQFDVVCRDLTKLVATTDQILQNKVCAQSVPAVVIEDGVYTASGKLDCTIRASYTGTQLTGLHAEFTGTSSDMTCAQNVCTGKFVGYPQTYTFKILDRKSFEYSYDNGQGRVVYTKK
ncbi:MAG: hypothetical protein C5B49_07790 [Bdellovibrio sp.]|nr:MAG: hypothetical protein C5B49_07790 [Bdellovibrio sp.]